MYSETDGVAWDDLLTGARRHGMLLNSAFCPVKSTWYLLVASADEDKHFYSIDIESSGVEYITIMTEMAFGEDPDDDAENYEDE